MTRENELGSRDLHCFDNHYNSGVLIDNWFDTRIYEANGRTFTLAMDQPVQSSLSVYTTDYTAPATTSIQPMMRRRGLGKELMFGTGQYTTFEGVPTSTTYGASQRHLIDSKWRKTAGSTRLPFDTVRETARFTFGNVLSTAEVHPTADDDLYGKYSSTKDAMDLSVACYHFQRQTTKPQERVNEGLMSTNKTTVNPLYVQS